MDRIDNAADSKRQSISQFSNEDYTVGWICALTTEYVAAQLFLDQKHEPPAYIAIHDNNNYTLGRVGKHNVAIAVLPAGEYGTASAAGVARDMLHTFPNIRIGLMVGIGGGAPSSQHDIRLGDVVVSQPRNGLGGVFQYDFGKNIQDQPFQPTRFLAPPPTVLLTAISGLQADYKIDGHAIEADIRARLAEKKKLQKEFSRPDAETDQLYRSHVIHQTGGASCLTSCGRDEPLVIVRPMRRDDEDNPAIHYGLIASANQLMKDAKLRDQFAEEKEVLCFEMEAGGLINNLPCLVIRGICDYSDTHKNKEWQGYAAMTAAAYAKDLLKRVLPNKVEAETRLSELAENVLSVSLETKAVSLDTKAAVQGIQTSSHFKNIIKWLSAPEPSTNLNKARELHQPGTGQWLLDNNKYRSWKADQGSFLWLYGIPGCGKTILSSTVVADLDEDPQASPGLLYFYFNFTDVEKRSTEKAVRSLIDQLYRKSAEARGVVDSLYDTYQKTGRQPSHALLQNVLEAMITKCHEVWVILDGLDECETRSQHSDGVMPWVKRLRALLPNVHILATSRPEDDIKSSIEEWAAAGEMIPLQSSLVAEDIAAYIDAKLRQMDRWRNEPEIQELIATTLNKRAGGMFRWVACQFDVLEHCLSLKHILGELNELPRTLDETYARIFERIRPEYKRDAVRLLQLLTYSPRPLRLEEAVDAMAVEPSNKPRFDIRNRMPIPEEIIRFCSSLVSLTSDPPITIQLAHFSVQEYLQSDRLEPHLAKQFDKTTAATAIVELCLSYLLELDMSLLGQAVDTQRPRRITIPERPFAEFSAQNWSKFAAIVESSSQGVLDTAKEYYASHDIFVLGQMLNHPYTLEWHLRDKVASPLCYASSAGLPYSVRMLIETDRDVSAQDGKFRDALLSASYAGHQVIVEILVENGAAASVQGALQAASTQGHQGIVEFLLQKGANINLQGGLYGSAIYAASCNGHEGCVRVLVNHGADVYARSGFYGNALAVASYQGHQGIVEMLVNNDVEVKAESELYDNALSAAAFAGYRGIVELLLQKGASINAQGGLHGYALHAASRQGHRDIVEMLAQKGADVNVKHSYYGTSLHVASHQGHQDIVRILLANGADATEQGEPFGNALHAATRAGHEGIVRLLLQNGADVGIWAARAAHATALSRGHEGIANLIRRHYRFESKRFPTDPS